jgi:hypothetical protein
MAYLLEVDNYFNQIHVDFRLKDKREIVINDLKEKNYEHKRRFSWKYMCKHDYFYLDSGIELSISYANSTLSTLKRGNLNEYEFCFDLNPYGD